MAASPQGFKVALLASDEGIRHAASAVLTACAYKVTPAVSVEDCLQLCTVQRIDIVLAESSDLTLNKEKTLQLTASLKNVPLIVMSDADTPATVFHGLKIGAVDFLKRPLDEAKVRSMWQHTLQKRMTVVPSLGDEGSSQGPRRPQPTLPSDPPGTGTARSGMVGPGLSEGSSNEQRLGGHSTLESTPVTHPDAAPETAQNFPSEQRNVRSATERPSDTASASTPMGPSVQPHGGEPRKRTQRTGPEGQRRKIRSTGGAGSSAHGTTSTTSTAGMTFPPLLGIPPGCVPPVGSNGLAIGMPFLNQHPFVPTTPMNPVRTFGFMPPCLYGPGGDLDFTRGGVSAALDPGHVDPSLFPPLRPSASDAAASVVSRPLPVPAPSSLPLPAFSTELHRSASTPVATTQDDISAATVTAAATTQHDETNASSRPLRKSPSLVNF